MTITTILAFVYMRGVLKWNWWLTTVLFGFFLVVDVLFLSANMLKIEEGGWFPLAVAVVIYTVMSTWRRGRQRVTEVRSQGGLPLETFLAGLKPDRPVRVPGTAVFTTANNAMVPNALLHNLKHNQVLAERVILMTIHTEDIPHVPDEQRLEIRHLDKNFHTITLRYGFMDQPNIPRALAQCRVMHFQFKLLETSFFVGREKIVPGKRTGSLWHWRKGLFVFMANTMLDATEFFRIPPNRVIELGGQIEI